MRRLWAKISQNGISELDRITEQEIKRRVFFNRVLFIGLIAVLLQIPSVWPFLGVWSWSFLIVELFLISCLVLNHLQYFVVSKWVYVLGVYSFGIYTTTLMGGSLLYHIQSMMILFSCLILFDWPKEKLPILLAIPCTVLSILIGELGWFGAPDFSNHPMAQITRIMNLISIIAVTTIFILFIINLNKFSENVLSKVVKDVTKTSHELEAIVIERTSEISKQRDILKRQNEEKEILLKEVHHRVRNNLQIIVSLINLQLESISNDKITLALREIQSRVNSMSLVHQKMYQSSNFKAIRFTEYTNQIITNLKNLYDNEDVSYEVDIPLEFKLELDQAIPMGLILNEMISNFFKHAYIDKNSYFKITVEFAEHDFQLVYQDNGPGFPDGFEITDLNSLGVQLISNLTEQLEGTCRFENNNGACYKLRVPRITTES